MSVDAAAIPFPLSLAGEGERVRIVALRAGRGLDQRLTEMGLHVGSEIHVRQRQPGGGLVVVWGETRLALGAGMAHRILVSRT
jgi:ferrous iron transport protein A